MPDHGPVVVACAPCGSSFRLKATPAPKFKVKCPSCQAPILVDVAALQKAAGTPPTAPAPAPSRIAPRQAPKAAAEPDAKALADIERLREELATRFDERMSQSFFELLGVDKTAGDDAIKSAYYKLIRKYHPDRVAAHLETAELDKLRSISARINEAFDQIKDAEGRERYITILEKPEKVASRDVSGIIQAMTQYEKGKAYLNNGKLDDALECFQYCTQLHPEEAEYHFVTGTTLQRMSARGPMDERPIEQAYRKAVELMPREPKYRMQLGHFLKGRGDHAGAMKIYREVLKLHPDHHEAQREIRLEKMRKDKARQERDPPSGKLGSFFGRGKKR